LNCSSIGRAHTALGNIGKPQATSVLFI